jgi:carbon-monoxide dehydrogenase small subunit
LCEPLNGRKINAERVTVGHAVREEPMGQITVKVNGRAVSRQIEDRTLLVEFLRETLGLTGTHVGCDTGQCGACTIHLDGRAVKSCTLLAGQATGSEIVTIEGLAKGDELHPMQAAFREHHALQCGFCTPGMIMTAVDLLNRIPNPDEATIRANLDGNLCRCTGYHNIVKAIAAVAASNSALGRAA